MNMLVALTGVVKLVDALANLLLRVPESREAYLQKSRIVNQMLKDNREPTAQEWQILDKEMDAVHDAIQNVSSKKDET